MAQRKALTGSAVNGLTSALARLLHTETDKIGGLAQLALHRLWQTGRQLFAAMDHGEMTPNRQQDSI